MVRATARVRQLIPVAGTLGLAILVASSVDLRGTWNAIAGFPVLAALLCTAIALFEEVLVGPFKWRFVVRDVGVPLSLREAILIRVGSQPVRAVAPLKSGEALPVAYLSRVHKLPAGLGAGTVVFEKAVNAWSAIVHILVALGLLGFWIAWPALALWTVIPFVRGPVRWLASRVAGDGKIRRFAGDTLQAILSIRPGTLALQLPLAILFTGLEIVNTAVVLKVLGAEVPFAVVLLTVPISYFLNNVPVTFLGIGMREGFFVLMLSGLAGRAEALATGVLVSAFEYVVPTLVGLLFSRRFLARMTAGPS